MPRPPPLLLLTAAAFLVTALTYRLALWQFDRATQKRAWEDAAAAAVTSPPVTVRTAVPPIAAHQNAAIIGAYLPQSDILLENRLRNRRAGYHVVTPFALADGGAILVKRGWLPAALHRDRLPTVPPPPPGRLTVRGTFQADNATAYRLSSAPETGKVRQNLVIAEIATQTGLPLLSLILLRRDDPKDVHKSPLPAVPLRANYKSKQSTIYAWQWLSFSALTVIFYLILARRLLRRRRQ